MGLSAFGSSVGTFLATDDKISRDKARSCAGTTPSLEKLEERQTTHLIRVLLKHLLYVFFRGCFGPLIYEKQQEEGPNPPP